ncbi:MAG: hypothetical protein ACJASQ_002975 [Crocinitomicaceae bacterium]
MNFREAIHDERLAINEETFNNVDFYGNQGQWYAKRFVDCIFNNGFRVQFNSGEITFLNCVFDESTDALLSFTHKGNFKFENCTFHRKLTIKTASEVSISDTKIKGTLKFQKHDYDEIKIWNTEFIHHIAQIAIGDILNSESGNIEFNNLDVGEVIFSDYIGKKVRIWNGNYGNIYLNNVQNLQNLQIWGDNATNNTIKIKQLMMHYLNLEGYVLIKFAEIDSWDISPFDFKKGAMRMQSVVINKEAIITQSNLSKVQFNDVNFSNAKLILDGTFLSETRFANILWPKEFLVTSGMTSGTKEEMVLMLHAKREVYRQLKKVSSGEANNIEALKFFRNEMATYWERVKLDKTESRANRFLIRVNRATSNFGQSYWYPIFWMLGIHLFLCTGIWIVEAHELGVLFNGENLDVSKGIKEFFTWLIPIYKAPENWTDVSATIGVFTRVFSGFFIFHIIKATRKFGKV